MNKDKIKSIRKKIKSWTGDTSPGSHELERRDQVVVLGSHLAGARSIVDKVNAHLQESSQPAVYCRDVRFIEDAIFGTNPDDSSVERTAPSGVILLPTMRQYDIGGRGMTVRTTSDKDIDNRTVFDIVTELCEQYGIPLEYMENPSEDINPRFLGKIATL